MEVGRLQFSVTIILNKTTGILNSIFKTHFALFYVAGVVFVWTIFYFEVKHIHNSLLYTALLESQCSSSAM